MHIGRLETDVRERSAQVDSLSSQLQEMKVEKSQLVQQLASINSLLEASQAKEEGKNQVGHHSSLSGVGCGHVLTVCPVFQQGNAAELEQLRLR